jgi:hypothetical protein
MTGESTVVVQPAKEGERPGDGAPLWHKLWAKRSEPDVFLETVIIVLILIELLFSTYFGWKEIKASDELTGLLVGVRKQAELQADQQRKSLGSMIEMSSVLQNQLDILKAEQKARLEETAQKPRLQLLVKGVALPADSSPPLQLPGATPTSAVIDLTMRNYGALYAQDVVVTATAERSDVRLNCTFPGRPTLGGTISQPKANICQVAINFIGHDWNEDAHITASYPKGTRPFNIEFAMWATNYLRRRIGWVRISPSNRQTDAQTH